MDEKKVEKLVKLAESGGGDKELLILDEIEALEEKFDSTVAEIKSNVPDLDKVLASIKGKDADPPSDAKLRSLIKPLIPEVKNGENYNLTESDKRDISRLVKVPIVEKVIERTEVIKEQPIVTEIVKVTNEIKEVAITETPDQITDKVNLGTPLIKKERVEGLADLERIAKNNNYDVRQGVSLSDLKPLTTGPAYSVVNDIPLFADTSGKVFKDSGVNLTAAGTAVLSFPQTTDTLVGRATTDTLTSKTLTSPIINTQLLGADGTASLPGLSFSSDTGTGIFRSGSGTMDFVTNATTALRFNGNLILRHVNVYQWGSNGVTSVDTGFSRISAGKVGIGNGTQGSVAGVFIAANIGIGQSTPTALLHLAAGTATANTAPLKFTTGTITSVAVAGQVEYNNRFILTESDTTNRFVVQAVNATKTTAAAPYTNDGYVTITINGTDFKVMTTA